MTARLSLVPDPMTPTQAVTRGRPTRLRRAQPPAMTDTAWWLVFVAAFLLFLFFTY